MHFLTSFTKFHAMPDIPRHPNKDIRAAIAYAVSRGWRIEKAEPRAHIWGRALCPERSRAGHIFYIHSTPRNPTIHARKFRRYIDVCAHTLRR